MLRSFFFSIFTLISLSSLHGLTTIEDKENYTSALASLIFAVQPKQEINENNIHFTQEEINSLWDRAAHYLYKAPLSPQRIQRESHFEKAYQLYFSPNKDQSKELNQETLLLLEDLWSDAITDEENDYRFSRSKSHLRTKVKKNQDFENNTLISEKIKSQMRRYVIPDSHPMKATMDSIFEKRVTLNEHVFIQEGFRVISKRPRSYVYVAKHPRLSGYLVKAYMDTEMRLKQYRESWDWLVKRCQGAAKIKQIIQTKKIKHFTVADKWLYPLPDKNLPPKDGKHKRHLAVLLARDMRLTSYEENLKKWKTIVNKEYLDELYIIISRAKGSSYRPDNICYTKYGNFAFIDTEYPSRGPDYDSIRQFLSEPMQRYWDSLVKKGIRTAATH